MMDTRSIDGRFSDRDLFEFALTYLAIMSLFHLLFDYV